jgi:hypothetical protein
MSEPLVPEEVMALKASLDWPRSQHGMAADGPCGHRVTGSFVMGVEPLGGRLLALGAEIANKRKFS